MPAADAFGSFQPCSPSEMHSLLHTATFPWWIAGGWAIDLFVGQQTRHHDDIDIEVLRQDLRALRHMFATWEMHAPHPSVRSTAWPFVAWPPETLPSDDVYNVWCRPTSTAPWVFEILIANNDNDQWLCRRDPSIHRSLDSLVLFTSEGIPYLTPEIQLLYKAKDPRPKDQLDFLHALPLLTAGQHAWLAESLAQIAPQHEWLAALTA